MDATLDFGKALKGSGTLLKAAASLQTARAAGAEGEAVAQARAFEARQFRIRGGQTRASAQRKAQSEKRNEELVQSALQARAAASGAGASDPTVEALARDIAAEGSFRTMTALFEGEELARALESWADLKDFEGSEARRAGKIKRRTGKLSAGATLLSGFEDFSLFKKYGEKIDQPEGFRDVFGQPYPFPAFLTEF